MSKKAVITDKPPVEATPATAAPLGGAPAVVTAATPAAVVTDPPRTADGTPVPVAENVTPIVEVPADTPARILPDALAGETPGKVKALEPHTPVVMPSGTVTSEDYRSYQERLAEKVRAGLTKEQAAEVLENQAKHDAGLE